MNEKTILILGIITVIFVLAFIAVQFYKKKNLQKMFEQLSLTSKQVPKSKRNSFLLLMFMESMSAPMNKSKAALHMSKLNNPKYLEIQLLQMSKILKDPSSVQDKRSKQALKLLDNYLSWEEEKKKVA